VSFAQALLYFLREAAVSLVRSWKVSVLAVVTIGVSLYVGGAFLLLGSNLAELARDWRQEARVVVYLEPSAPAEARQALIARARAQPWVAQVVEVGPEEAAARFRATFPSLAGLVEAESAAGGSPLPPSVEVRLAAGADAVAVSAWAETMRGEPGVDMVDDDRDWLGQLEAMIALVRGAGLVLGGVLLGAAVFTIASVIRLTAFLYHEEIAVMRLVGATEFYIRGPFYAEGLLQGLLGGAAAVAALFATWRVLAPEAAATGLLSRVLAPGFFSLREVLGLVLVGGAAGLVGALLSLRGERLDEVAEVGESAAEPTR
jgi:cell division transport system permease protein